MEGQAEQEITVVTSRMQFLERRAPRWLAPVGVAAVLLLWQAASSTGLVSQADLPSPAAIAKSAYTLALDGQLLANVTASLIRIALGYGIGAAAGVIFGLALGFSRVGERIGMPIVTALYPVPKLAIIPLIILWIGTGEWPKILVIAAEVAFPVLLSTFTGVRHADAVLIRAAVSFGATRRAVMFKVILPAALPSIFAGLRIGAGLSLLILVAAEMIGAQHGIGAMILEYSSLMETSRVLVGVVVLSALGLLITKGLAWLEKRLLPWRES